VVSDRLSALFEGAQQMSVGERAAVEGVLALAQPGLALEIGTAEGGSLRRIAAHSGEVHSFDLVEPAAGLRELDNVHFHTGSSHELLSPFLAELAAEGRNVDFALVDGDHSAAGVRRDLEDLLASPAIRRTLILVHDTANEEVRAGVDAVGFDRVEQVVYADLDAVAGAMYRVEPLRHQLWGGIGVIVVDAERRRGPGEGALERRRYPTARLLREAKALRAGGARTRARALGQRFGRRPRGTAGG
jgi:hypothetical protein